MRIPGIFGTLFASLNPFSTQLSEGPIHRSVGFMLTVILFSVLVLSVLSIPDAANFASLLKAELSKVSKLEFEANVETSSPAKIPILPIVLDSSANQTSNGVLVSGRAISYERPLCALFPLACIFQKKTAHISLNSSNLQQDTLVSTASSLLVVLLPTIIVMLFVSLALKYLLIVLAVSIAAFFIVFAVWRDLKLGEVFNTVAYSSSVMIVPQVLNLKFALPLSVLPLLAFLLLVASKIAVLQFKEQDGR